MRLTARELFLSGKDTIEIASYFGISEAEALEDISLQRSQALGLKDPYLEPKRMRRFRNPIRNPRPFRTLKKRGRPPLPPMRFRMSA